MSPQVLKLYELTGKKVLVTRESARSLASALSDALASADGDVTLDFSGIEGITPSFVDEILSLLEALEREEHKSVRVVFVNPPTRLSAKFAALASSHGTAISEPQQGVWTFVQVG